MTIVEEEKIILKRVYVDINKDIDCDGVNKDYRQVRVFNRYHLFLAWACSHDMYVYFKNKFKSYRKETLAELMEGD